MSTLKWGLLGCFGTMLLLFSLGGYAQVALKDNVGWSYHGVTGPDSWGYLTSSYQLCKTKSDPISY